MKKTIVQKLFNYHSLQVLLFSLVVSSIVEMNGQQVTAEFEPKVSHPMFALGKGPLILIDESHHNFHTISPITTIAYGDHQSIEIPGRFSAFKKILIKDGFKVIPLKSGINSDILESSSVLVIANALSERNVEDWSLPNPSAFSIGEIKIIVSWVAKGGSLLLIADHQPWPGAASELAEQFGVLFYNGSTDILYFNRLSETLNSHPVTEGRNDLEKIDSLITFGGQAFRFKPDLVGEPLLVIGENQKMDLHWNPFEPYTDKVPSIRIDGMFQGAVIKHQLGRVAIFGEAAMFTAQLSNGNPMGINHPQALQHTQFILNLFHWLINELE